MKQIHILNENTFLTAVNAMHNLDYNAYFVHSDMLRGFQIKIKPFSAESLIEAHIQALFKLTGNTNLIFPTFNLQFPKTKAFNVKSTPSEMGYISEYFRNNFSTWRTISPLHSCCGNGVEPSTVEEGIIDPWSVNGIFGQLVSNENAILFYGASFESISMIHYLEKQCSVPYRYEKLFHGTSIDKDQNIIPVTVSHIVRPMEYNVTYDWNKLYMDLEAENLILNLGDKRTRLFIIPADKIFRFWSEKLQNDPFYFVTEKTKKWAAPLFHKLGRPFKINDFES